jgi:molybdopterin-guanine dinucleotide biosynthesis protein B
VGADLVILAAPQQLVSWRHPDQEPSLAEILRELGDIDLAIVEGYRRVEMPRIEIWRREQGGEPITPGDQLIAWVSDGEQRAGVPNLALDDIRGAADLLCARFGLIAK